ncbi:hypothetical protein CLIB1423_14S01882 [[Candida] railenensis]|uniref:Uncharacterized protein n=1 Tax=[Candida] railenensis TaxID=45579 RepID=A0A9P0QT37_9ASCO|nr:hypothetical protein CLIB1423_14S01882 [[Candida] railenensis]
MSSPPYHNDKLPEYSSTPPTYKSSLSYYGLSLVKTEFNSPYHYNHGKRSWKPVLLELNSTQLIIYDVKFDRKLLNLVLALYHSENYLEEVMEMILTKKSEHLDFVEDLFSGDAYSAGSSASGTGLNGSINNKSAAIRNKFQRSKFSHSLTKDLNDYYDIIRDNQLLFEPTTSEVEYAKFSSRYRGEKLHTYTIQNSRFGRAPTLKEYFKNGKCNPENLATLVKYKNSLRVRIELKQMLFQFWSFYGFTEWYRQFGISKDLSTSIDDRELTKLRTIPARYTRWLHEWVQISEELGLEFDTLEGMSNFATNASSPAANGSNFSDEKDSLSLYSSRSSVFDRERSMSISSTDTIATSTSTGSNSGALFKKYDKFKIYSLDNYYTPLEQHYITNCVSKLNTFDKWTGVGVTISNFHQYLNAAQLKRLHMAPEGRSIDLFIDPSKLENSSLWKLGRKKNVDKVVEKGECRQFIILQHGLVSVVS